MHLSICRRWENFICLSKDEYSIFHGVAKTFQLAIDVPPGCWWWYNQNYRICGLRHRARFIRMEAQLLQLRPVLWKARRIPNLHKCGNCVSRLREFPFTCRCAWFCDAKLNILEDCRWHMGNEVDIFTIVTIYDENFFVCLLVSLVFDVATEYSCTCKLIRKVGGFVCAIGFQSKANLPSVSPFEMLNRNPLMSCTEPDIHVCFSPILNAPCLTTFQPNYFKFNKKRNKRNVYTIYDIGLFQKLGFCIKHSSCLTI